MIQYKHKLLTGDCLIHEDFVPSMDLFCRYLEIVKCSAIINSSFRKDANVKGAIVTPATKSNHMVGCAIDCNILDSKNVLWNSEKMEKPKDEVLQFINLVRRSKLLRWGGDFKTIDTVHFDNALNINSPTRWQEIYIELHK